MSFSEGLISDSGFPKRYQDKNPENKNNYAVQLSVDTPICLM
jgi:hypothetical protein